jgi:hypothetical protein
MKRSTALTPLSHDHQHALDAAFRLRRAERDTLAAALEHFERFFETEGRRHFDIEERLILPALPAEDTEWTLAVARVRADHDAIRARAGALRERRPIDDALADARELGERLAAHVRFEERELFATLERRLGTAVLARLGEAVAAAEQACVPWSPTE